MKRVFLLLMSVGTFLNSYTQIHWGEESSEWTYEGLGYVPSYNTIKYYKDTILLEKQAKVYEVLQVIKGNSGVVNKKLRNFITFSSDSTVYYYRYNANVFDTLYSFNLVSGSKWILHCDLEANDVCTKDVDVIVVDTLSIAVNGQLLKSVIVDYNFDDMGIVRDTILERIGSVNLYINPIDYVNRGLDAHEGDQLRCYNDDVIGYYNNNYVRDCFYLTHYNERYVEDFSSIELFPNPCNDYTKLSTQLELQKIVVILDINGKILANKKLENDGIISFDDISEGLYIVVVRDYKSMYYLPIIKQ